MNSNIDEQNKNKNITKKILSKTSLNISIYGYLISLIPFLI